MEKQLAPYAGDGNIYTEGQRHWDRGDAHRRRIPDQRPSHFYNSFTEGQVKNATRSQYHEQMPNPDLGMEKPAEQDMEIGYEDRPSRLTFEALEKKFCDETMQLAKEHTDAEDAENARHKEMKTEINSQYQEKLLALRALQAKRREEFLQVEAQERINQYKQTVSNKYPTNTSPMEPRGYPRHYPAGTSPVDPRGYGPNLYPTETPNITADPNGYGPKHYPTETNPANPRGYGGPIETHRSYAPEPLEPYKERSPYHHQVQRNQQDEGGRVPIPQGRAYNNTRARNNY